MPSRRTILGGALGFGLTGCTSLHASAAYDAVVTKAATSLAGAHVFKSVSEAIAAAPSHGTKPYRILVTAGTWRERVVVDKPFIHLIGEGRNASTIVFNKSAGDKGPDGQSLGTFGTASMVVAAPDFSARHLTISNDFDYVAHMPKPVPDDKTGANGSQANALAIQDAADRTFLEDVAITGWQDTLYTNAGRSLFRKCLISGCVDFIFGAGIAVFENCEIVSRIRPGQEFHGYIAAPSTKRYQPYGMVFVNCRLTKEQGMPPHTVALGRPWHRTLEFPDGRYGDPDAIGATVYLHCWMDDHIVPEGWYAMGYNIKGGGRGMFQPEDARLFEFDSSGPGAGAASAKRRILTAEQARAFEPQYVLQGWSP